MSRNTRKGENGKKSPEGWRFKLDGKSDPFKNGDFGENAGDSGTNGEKSPGPLVSGDLGENSKIWHKQRKITRALAISRMWQIFKLDAKRGPFKLDDWRNPFN